MRMKEKPIELPNQDYTLDLYAVLDNAVRICGATAQLGAQMCFNMNKVVEVIKTSQCMVQGCGYDFNFAKLFQRGDISFRQLLLMFKKSEKQFTQQQITQLKQFPLMRFQIFAKFQQTKTAHNIELNIEFSNISNYKIPSGHKSDCYTKPKPNTYYVMAGHENVEGYMKLAGAPNGGRANVLIPSCKKARVIVQSDLFVGLGLDVEVKMDTVGMDFVKIYDSEVEDGRRELNEGGELNIVVE